MKVGEKFQQHAIIQKHLRSAHSRGLWFCIVAGVLLGLSVGRGGLPDGREDNGQSVDGGNQDVNGRR